MRFDWLKQILGLSPIYSIVILSSICGFPVLLGFLKDCGTFLLSGIILEQPTDIKSDTSSTLESLVSNFSVPRDINIDPALLDNDLNLLHEAVLTGELHQKPPKKTSARFNLDGNSGHANQYDSIDEEHQDPNNIYVSNEDPQVVEVPYDIEYVDMLLNNANIDFQKSFVESSNINTPQIPNAPIIGDGKPGRRLYDKRDDENKNGFEGGNGNNWNGFKGDGHMQRPINGINLTSLPKGGVIPTKLGMGGPPYGHMGMYNHQGKMQPGMPGGFDNMLPGIAPGHRSRPGNPAMGGGQIYGGQYTGAPHKMSGSHEGPDANVEFRWDMDPAGLNPKEIQSFVTKQDTSEWDKDRNLWAAFYGFDKVIECSSTIRPQHYRLKFLSILGAGGQGLVLCALDLVTNAKYAVKVLRLKKDSKRRSALDDQILQRRVRQETVLWKRLPSHVNPREWSRKAQLAIPLDAIQPLKVLEPEAGDTNKYSPVWVIYDVFAGDMAHMGKILEGPTRVKVEATKQMVYSCMAIHSMGLVHSDIKMLNYFVEDTGRIFLGDHALSRPLNNNGGCLDGTPRYLPPENMRCLLKEKRRILTSERKDSWAVGVVLYKLFCSTYPYDMRDLWATELFDVVGNSNIADLDFTQCPNKTPLVALSLIRLLLNPNVASRPTLRDLYLHHPFFQMSNEDIVKSENIGTVKSRITKKDSAKVAEEEN